MNGAAMDTRSLSHPEQLLAELDWLRALARALVFDDQVADDLVQSTWLAALRSPPDTGRPLRPWLRRVMSNLARERVRSDRVREAREVERARESAAAPAPEDVLERVELQKLVAELVLALDEPFRTTVLLRYHRGLSAAEIARRDGTPQGTVRARLKEGLDRLRAQLDRRFGGDRRAWSLAFVALAREDVAVVASVAGLSWWKLAVAAIALASVAWFATRGAERAPAPIGAAAATRLDVASPSSATASDAVDPSSSAGESARAAARVDGFHGRVVRASGEPVPKALVWLYASADFDPEQQPPLHATTTDELGRFEFPGLDARGLWAFVGPDDLGVAIEPVAADELDITLRERDQTLLIRGRVVAEQPLRDPFVVTASTRSSREPDVSNWGGRATIADASGRFALAVNDAYGRASELSVAVAVPGFKLVSSDWLAVERAQSVELVLGERSPRLRGIVVDAAGAPIEGASIAVVGLAGGDEETLRSAADGSFTCATLRGDGYGRLVAAKAGFAQALVEHVDRTPGADWLDVRVRLYGGARISGRVHGATLDALRVELMPDRLAAFGRADVVARAGVDDAGHFAIEAAPSGRWWLAVVSEADDATVRLAPRELLVEPGVAQLVDVELPQRNIAFEIGGIERDDLAFEVLLLDAASGAVEHEMRVTLESGSDFALPCVRDGEHVLRVHPGTPDKWIERPVRVAGRDVDLGVLRFEPESFVRENWQRLYGDAPMTSEAVERAARAWRKVFGD